MRSALFVDFDNVYSGLARLGVAYADAFARNPSRWLQWLTDALPTPEAGADSAPKRRILVRRCYLNPEPYKRYRLGFSRAGFEIVDCPPMTSAGKTSTDIHMVLDMVDVLQAQTRYDEFIVFSADADFTPLLRKLRREDRRTTVFAAGATSAAYDASADLMIDSEAFIQQALGIEEDLGADRSFDLASLMAQAESVVWKAMDQTTRPVSMPALTHALATQVPGLVDSRWAGKGNFLALLKSLPLTPLRIDRELNALVDPRRREPGAPPSGEAGQGEDQEASLAAMLARELEASDRPIAVARLAQLARDRFPGIERHWLGQGSWKKLLEQFQGPNLTLEWVNLAGYALDPQRHRLNITPTMALTDNSPASAAQGSTEVFSWLAAASLPALPPEQYGAIFEGLSEALEARPFSSASVTRLVQAHCEAQGQQVDRRDVYALMRALLFNGFDPNEDSHTRQELITFTAAVIVAACRREGVKILDGEKMMLLEGLGG